MRIPFSTTPILIACFGLIAVKLHAAPIIPGLEHKHPLTETQKGTVLIEELRCASCHEGMSKPKAAGPDLREVGSRVQPEFLKKFIQDPALHDPGTAMPDVFGERSAEEQEKIATELSAYLLSLQSEPAKNAALPKDKAADGKKLFHEIGCISCHSPQDDNAEAKSLTGNVNLAHVSKKYHPAGLADFLHEPLKVRPDGRMPDMRLSRSEAELLAAFMIGSEPSAPGAETHSPATIAAGKKAFTEMSCNACHNVDSDPKPPLIPAKAKLDLNAGCLSATPGKAPNYQLSDVQKKAIRLALTENPKKATPAESINMRLTQMNCISCHQRDDFGGVKPALDSYFHSTEEALGNESRIPPPLTLVGAKLRPEWLNKVLFEGETVRPYMTTRMPQYGNQALDGLPQAFAENDKLEPFDYPPIMEASAPMMRDEGHRLLGDQGLSCISCHNYNGIESPSMKGLDLMTSYQRLQPAWFDQFMKNPAKFRPGIIMPSFWPDGKAVQTEILDGNTDVQLQALWNQFSLGRSARDPSGLRAEDPELVVTDQIRTYRGRSTVAGYRGIAVGFPGGMNYAFNAHNGALSAFWSGKYVKVGWRGQGSGNFSPAGPVIQLAEDVAFLTELPETWPLKPVRTKESPVNPDPTYPSQHAYSFKGYSIGEQGVPTLRYRCGEISIEDTSSAASKNNTLNRTLTFTSAKATTLYFRALSGTIESVSENSFKIPKLQLNLGKSTAKFSNILRNAGSNQELILKLELPAGTSTLSLDYVLQP
ncbi:MAG: c-type cytochrome [Verrucomicrobiota bacterium]